MLNNLKGVYPEILCWSLCLLNLFTPIIPQPILYLVVMCFAVKRLPIEALAFCCLMFLRDINHAMFFLTFHIPMMSYVTVLVGLFIMWNYIRGDFNRIVEKGKYLWLIMGYMLLSMLIADNIGVNFQKFTEMFMTGVLAYIAYAYIFYQREKIDFYRLAIYCTIFALFLLQLNVVANNYGGPSSLIDFGFYRTKVGTDMYANLAEIGISYATHYQFFGTVCTIGFTLCMAFRSMSLQQVLTLLVANIVAIGYTGARQYLIIMFVLFAIYILLMKGNVVGKALIIIGGVSVVSYIMYQSVMSDYVNVISDKGFLEGTGRNELFETGIRMFKANPIFGVGFGGYNYFGAYAAYPHNMIVELLAEVGAFGLFFVVVCVLWNRRGLSLLYKPKQGIVLMYIVLAFFMRSMISQSLTGNVVLFSVLSAMTYFCCLPNSDSNTRVKI